MLGSADEVPTRANEALAVRVAAVQGRSRGAHGQVGYRAMRIPVQRHGGAQLMADRPMSTYMVNPLKRTMDWEPLPDTPAPPATRGEATRDQTPEDRIAFEMAVP
jgi:hypothetical protein